MFLILQFLVQQENLMKEVAYHFVIDLKIKQSHVGFALLKNILHYLIHSISRDNQLPVLILVVNYIYLINGDINCNGESTVILIVMVNCAIQSSSFNTGVGREQ